MSVREMSDGIAMTSQLPDEELRAEVREHYDSLVAKVNASIKGVCPKHRSWVYEPGLPNCEEVKAENKITEQKKESIRNVMETLYPSDRIKLLRTLHEHVKNYDHQIADLGELSDTEMTELTRVHNLICGVVGGIDIEMTIKRNEGMYPHLKVWNWVPSDGFDDTLEFPCECKTELPEVSQVEVPVPGDTPLTASVGVVEMTSIDKEFSREEAGDSSGDEGIEMTSGALNETPQPPCVSAEPKEKSACVIQ